jgi:apolipoprotein N-acyltransferase
MSESQRPAPYRRALDGFAARPWLVAPLLGALAACGFRPLAFWPATLLGIAGLIALVARARTARGALLVGWLWGVAHFTLGNNWIATAFTFQAKMPGWLGGIAVFLLSLYLAVYPALAALGARLLGRRGGWSRVLAFAGCWIVSEWLRGWVFSGFAWNPLAVVALGPFDVPGLAALAPWLGTYALSGLVALLAGCWYQAAARRPDWRSALLAALPILLLLQPGILRAGYPNGRGIAYTLIQPGIPQELLDDPAHYEAQFQRSAALSQPLGSAPHLVLWPESGVQDYLRAGYPAWIYRASTFAGDPLLARARIAHAIGPQALLLTGSVDLDMKGDTVLDGRNVVTALDGQGEIRGSYAKAHLVPYGEYLPMRGLLEPLGLARLVPGEIDFAPGPGPQTLDLGRYGKAGIQICYEIVFSGEVVDRAHRPDYIFNPSNDGWFGSWGPPQQLAQARLRAIEEGLPVLRSTTDGISAVIDADGIVRQSLPTGVAGRLDGVLPPAHPPTLFARLGNGLALAWAALWLVASQLVIRRRRG